MPLEWGVIDSDERRSRTCQPKKEKQESQRRERPQHGRKNRRRRERSLRAPARRRKKHRTSRRVEKQILPSWFPMVVEVLAPGRAGKRETRKEFRREWT